MCCGPCACRRRASTSALRISFGPESTREDIDALLAGLEEVAARLRK